ncbi:bacteriocin [Flavobacterium amniphilum]|uniref:bacteriocin n=1 Tax=Flavobacterium amniphilum TaxID=1834035 RepID=UPI00202A2CA8|nr:bacteriocin [Flavobacterium amniphilum]MCL9805750.1 bacteriocin [Flavobacterium amniphilum]MCL9806337.1 bacteriocin [Flavobacterium amniphilum]
MLKNKLKDLKKGFNNDGKSIEVINEKDLQNIKGGKLVDCPKLKTCDNNSDPCPVLESCGTNCTPD